MSLLEGNKEILNFRLMLESVYAFEVPAGTAVELLVRSAINSTTWQGREPRSCRVINVQTPAADLQPDGAVHHFELHVQIGFRPDGWQSGHSADGKERLNGWDLERLDEARDGTLLDGQGQPLPAGKPPVYLRFKVFEELDFNQFEFGSRVQD